MYSFLFPLKSVKTERLQMEKMLPDKPEMPESFRHKGISGNTFLQISESPPENPL